MDKLLDLLFGTPWWLVLALAVYGFCFATYHDLYAHEPSRKRWIGYLAQNTWSNRYRDLLGRMLDWVDTRLTPEISDQDWKPDEARAAWSFGLLNLSLLLAVAYPILSVIVYWAVTDRDGGIGSLVLIEGGEPAWRRAATIGLLAGALTAAIIARRAVDRKRLAEDRKRLVYALVAYGLAFAGVFAAAVAGAVAATLASAVTFALAVALAVASAFAVAFAGAIAVAFAFGGAIAVAVAVAGTDAFAGTFAGAVAFAFAGVFVFAATAAVAVIFAQEPVGWRTGQRMLFLLLCAIVIFVAVAAALRFGSPVGPGASSTILFLAVLHGAVAVFGTGIHLWPGLREYIVEGLDAGGKGDAVKGRWAVRALCLSMTVSVVAPIFVLGHIVLYRGILGFWLLDLFEGFARMAGAI